MELNELSIVFDQRKSKLVALQKLCTSWQVAVASQKPCTSKNTKSSFKRSGAKSSFVPGTAKRKSGQKHCRKISSRRTCSSTHHVGHSLIPGQVKARGLSSTQTLSPANNASSRFVRVHPSKIPTLPRLRSLVFMQHSRLHRDQTDPLRWPEGQLLWGKLGGYPFWPCMVSRDPFTKLFTKAVGSLKESRCYHVQFFGKETERSWIHEASLLEFEGRDKYLNIVQYGLENPMSSCKAPSEFTISPSWYPAWSLAVAQAEAASKLDLETRKNQWTFHYMIARGKAQKPVDDLLTAIRSQVGGYVGTNDKKLDNGGKNSLTISAAAARPWYDSDDVYSSDESSSCSEDTFSNRPVKVRVRQGLLQVFLNKHVRFLQEEHPDWEPTFVVEYLERQWQAMSSWQRGRYTTRHQQPIFVELQPHVSPTAADDDHVLDAHQLDLQILQLSKTYHFVRREKLCLSCKGQGSDLVSCKGICGRYFHPACIQGDRHDSLLCLECCLDGGTACFACKKASLDLVVCSNMRCGKYYHQTCVRQFPLTSKDKTGGFTCPLHACLTCHMEDRAAARQGPFFECLRCPTAYHISDFCLTAGSQVVGRHHLVCASHFQPSSNCSQHSRVSIRRCMVCGRGGNLQQCQQCPAACHTLCQGEAYHKTSWTPTGPESTPTGPESTPTGPESTPTRSESTPTRPESTPTRPESTPTGPESTPTRSESTPTRPESTPTGPESTPTGPESTPTRSESTPTRPESTPTGPESTPTRSESTPTRPESTPTGPESTPTRPESTPTGPESTPTRPESTPTSHQQQQQLWLCHYCQAGRRPLYGDIVWVKLGFYRWWPGEVCHPHYVPKKVQVKKHRVGEFPVRFFGSHDFAWLHHGRVLPFHKGMNSCSLMGKTHRDQLFVEAVREATAAAKLCAGFIRSYGQVSSVTNWQ